MAPPPQGQMRPSRYLFTLAAIFVVLYGIVLGFGVGSLNERLKPKLGLDLVGGTTFTLVARTLDGGPPDATSLEISRQIIEQRVNGFGVAEAEVVTEGDRHIVISVPGQNNDAIRDVGTPAQMRFRKVLDITGDLPGPAPTVAPSASASPGPSGSAAPATSATPKPSAAAASPSPGTTPTASPTPPNRATQQCLSTAFDPKPTPSATPSASKPAAAPTATPSASASPNPSASPNNAEAELARKRAEVFRALGPAASVAGSITDPRAVSQDPTTLAQLEPFRKLCPAEVAILPTQMQFAVPQVTCAALNDRPAGSIDDVTQLAVACEEDGNTKYLLDVAKVVGRDLASASATIDTTAGSAWKVDLQFNGDGTAKWTALTREAYNNEGGACKVTQPNKQGGAEVCQVAVVLDNEVVSAPAIQGVLTSQSEITGGFNKTSATLLANQLRYGALPVTFEPGELSSISATLGTDYLKAGLLAAGIGMLLVIIYAFFYYRLLGSVIFLSLVLSAMLTFGMLVLLGRQIGFTVTLAGIAGFIVSLGVAADSFVIYFERLKDEIREGRSPRSAIPRAWTRARRTIITANAVTILAALVLYLVGVGSVRGFAFALGLATLLDLVIVFLFRHPMMTLLARTPAFLSPRVSGLGRVLNQAQSDASASGTRRSGPTRPKEA